MVDSMQMEDLVKVLLLIIIILAVEDILAGRIGGYMPQELGGIGTLIIAGAVVVWLAQQV